MLCTKCVCESVCVYPHHVRVWGVGQSERSPVVFLIQLSLFGVELIESVADLSAPLQSLGVLWKLRDKQQGLTTVPQCDLPLTTDWQGSDISKIDWFNNKSIKEFIFLSAKLTLPRAFLSFLACEEEMSKP